MSAGVRVPLKDAHVVADALVAYLRQGCERIELAGSIRREEETVGDIEIVAIPRTAEVPVPQMGILEEEPTETLDYLLADVARLRIAGVLVDVDGRKANGERYTKTVHAASGLPVDLFMVRPPATWGVIFLIRTGPAEFSKWLVTEAKRRRFHVVGGALHRGGLGCASVPCEVVDTPEEGDVMRALGVSYRPPQMRSAMWR